MSAAYLADQAWRHPALRPRDAIKLCYQAAYGAEHLLPDPAAAREYLRRELNACAADAAEPLYEEISPDLCRVNLRAWKARAYPEDALLALFLQFHLSGSSIFGYNSREAVTAVSQSIDLQKVADSVRIK